MADLGKAYVQIIPKATGINEKIKEQVSPGAGAAGKAAGTSFVGKFAKVAGGAAIGAAVAKGLKAALDEGAKVQQSLAVLILCTATHRKRLRTTPKRRQTPVSP